MDRRSFVKGMATVCAAGQTGVNAIWAADADINATRIPHWRGFNLQGKFRHAGQTL
jgi:hypothetical protein